jgi:hypothetical protein
MFFSIINHDDAQGNIHIMTPQTLSKVCAISFRIYRPVTVCNEGVDDEPVDIHIQAGHKPTESMWNKYKSKKTLKDGFDVI